MSISQALANRAVETMSMENGFSLARFFMLNRAVEKQFYTGKYVLITNKNTWCLLPPNTPVREAIAYLNNSVNS